MYGHSYPGCFATNGSLCRKNECQLAETAETWSNPTAAVFVLRLYGKVDIILLIGILV